MTIDALKDVHTEHCCLKHGCKYGRDATCTVTQGYLAQSFPCEYCEREEVANWLPEATDEELLAEIKRRRLTPPPAELNAYGPGDGPLAIASARAQRT